MQCWGIIHIIWLRATSVVITVVKEFSPPNDGRYTTNDKAIYLNYDYGGGHLGRFRNTAAIVATFFFFFFPFFSVAFLVPFNR